MLTFKQSVILLVSIITILAIIAIVTGLSPLYWPHPKPLTNENNSSLGVIGKITNSSNLKQTQLTTRLKLVTKKIIQLTTLKNTTTLPVTTHLILANTSII